MLNKIAKINNHLPIPGEFAVASIMDLSGDALRLLNSNERGELSSFGNEQRKKEYLTSRLMLKKMALEMGMEEDSFIILKDELGRPCGKCGSADYCVSIAHTKKDVFCGITKHKEIGVDLEPASRRIAKKLKKRIMHPSETERLSSIETIRLWTIKEALIKLEGQGLRMNMNEVCVRQKSDEFFVEINNDKTAKICSFRTAGNWLAVAFYYEP